LQLTGKISLKFALALSKAYDSSLISEFNMLKNIQTIQVAQSLA